MKSFKRIAALCCAVLFLWGNVQARNGNMIKNGGFEQGTIGYSELHNYTVTDACAAEGKYSMHITNRTSNTESVRCDLSGILCEPGIYSFSVKFRLDAIQFDYSKMRGVITVVTDTGKFRAETDWVNAENGRFVCASATKAINWTGKIRQAYFSAENKVKSEMCDFYIDDFYLEFKDNTEENAKPSEKLTVGVLRSDGAYSKEKLVDGTLKQLLPYYYGFNGGGFAEFGDVTKSDIKYARYAGIDYFAYRPEDGTYAFHPDGSVGMCFVIGENTEISHIYALSEYFKKSNYQRYNGRELVIFSSGKNYAEKSAAIKDICPSAIIMMLSSDSFGQSELTATGGADGKAFESVAENDKSMWSSKNAICVKSGSQYPPERTEVLKHILSATEKAESGMNTVIIDSWNDCNNGKCILPTYKTDVRGEYEIRDGEMLLDTEIIDGLHCALNGEDLEIERTKKGLISGGTEKDAEKDELKQPETVPDKEAKQGYDELTALPTDKTEQKERNTAAPKTADKTNDEKEDNTKTDRRANRQKVIISGVTTFILLAGTVTYTVLTRKRKSENQKLP